MFDFVIITALGVAFLMFWWVFETVSIRRKQRKFERECAERDAKWAVEIERLKGLGRITYKAKK